jgi:hypothetical protein
MPVASPIARRYTVAALLTLTAVTGVVEPSATCAWDACSWPT